MKKSKFAQQSNKNIDKKDKVNKNIILPQLSPSKNSSKKSIQYDTLKVNSKNNSINLDNSQENSMNNSYSNFVNHTSPNTNPSKSNFKNQTSILSKGLFNQMNNNNSINYSSNNQRKYLFEIINVNDEEDYNKKVNSEKLSLREKLLNLKSEINHSQELMNKEETENEFLKNQVLSAKFYNIGLKLQTKETGLLNSINEENKV